MRKCSGIKFIILAGYAVSCTRPYQPPTLIIHDQCGENPRVLAVAVNSDGLAQIHNYRGRKPEAERKETSCVPIGKIRFEKKGDKFAGCTRLNDAAPDCHKVAQDFRFLMTPEELAK